MQRVTLIALLIMLTNPILAQASKTEITNNLIVEKNREMQTLLELRNPHKTMDFLHEHINDDARFKIKFHNPSLAPQDQKKSFVMNKADYINSFIQGLNYVDNYAVEIETKNIEISEGGKKAVAEEVIIEEGTMLNPNNLLDEGFPFLSKTTCMIEYGLYQGVLKSSKASCFTQTGEVSTI